MPPYLLDDSLSFPHPRYADEEGLLAIGGDLSTERLLLAYRNGIFPWYDEGPILWWSPDPRFVLFPGELKIARSIRPLLNRKEFDFTINSAFEKVIAACKEIDRPGQFGTWITDEVQAAYTQLHQLGYAHSAEVWKNGQLAGGMYGIKIGKVFFGESMFSRTSNASRYAFIKYVELLKLEGIELIDCQVYTTYLESLGARMIEGEKFRDLLSKLVK